MTVRVRAVAPHSATASIESTILRSTLAQAVGLQLIARSATGLSFSTLASVAETTTFVAATELLHALKNTYTESNTLAPAIQVLGACTNTPRPTLLRPRAKARVAIHGRDYALDRLPSWVQTFCNETSPCRHLPGIFKEKFAPPSFQFRYVSSPPREQLIRLLSANITGVATPLGT